MNRNLLNRNRNIHFSQCSDTFCYFAVTDTKKMADASKSTNLIPIYSCIFSDQLTPVLAYRCLVKEDDREAPSFLFESVEPGSQMSSVVRIIFFFLNQLIFFSC